MTDTDSIVISVVANQAPTAVINADVTGGQAPLTVHFTGSGSTDPDGTPPSNLTYAWDFGDGSWVKTTTSPQVDHHYAPGGAFIVRVEVLDALGHRAVTRRAIST